jgi:outer membrane protein OmpA-like peptidoglycan-associated protein
MKPLLRRPKLPSLLSLSLSVGLLTLQPTLSSAQDWGYQVTQQVRPGERATFSVSAPLNLKRVSLVLSSGSQRVTKRFKSLKAGVPTKVRFKPQRGSSVWSAELKGTDIEGLEQSVSFEFTVLSAESLEARVVTSESSLEGGLIVADSNNPLDRAELEAYGDEAEQLWTDTISFMPLKGKRGRYAARFERSPTPRRLDVKLYDRNESWVSVRLVRWYAEIPHEDVLFESGSSEIKASEEGKMSEAIKAVADELDRYRRAMGDASAQVDLQLYIGGYTDTVGEPRDNLKLSQARARSIASYFKRHRVEIPIIFAGFGERALLVKTPNNVDEPRNRRALYIVANSPPSGESFPSAQWRRLP